MYLVYWLCIGFRFKVPAFGIKNGIEPFLTDREMAAPVRDEKELSLFQAKHFACPKQDKVQPSGAVGAPLEGII